MIARSAFKPKRQNSHKADAEKRVPGYLQWLRGRDCAIGGQCAGKTEAAHVGGVAQGVGKGTKCHDRYAVPMCCAHHGEQHKAGIKTFEDRHGRNLLLMAEGYWDHWLNHTPMGAAWKAKQDG